MVGVDSKQLLQIRVMRGCTEFQAKFDIMTNPRLENDAEFTKFVRGIWPVCFYNLDRYIGELLRAMGSCKSKSWCHRAQKESDQLLQPGRDRHGFRGLGGITHGPHAVPRVLDRAEETHST